MNEAGTIRIGLSGWSYPPWRGHFYPEGLVQKHELRFAAEHFPTLEVNGTFYGLQRPETFAHWAEEVPEGFLFAVKAPRFITHIRRLEAIEAPVANFLASGLLRLGPKLGPLLWQLPPSLRFDKGLIADFLALLPMDTVAAAEQAKAHDGHLAGRAWLRTDARRPLRHALEIRHESFRTPAFVAMLREKGVALVCADSVKWPLLMDLTADFAYCRLHGSRELYRSGYDAAEIARWAARIEAWASGAEMRDGAFAGDPASHRPRDVFLFFDNTDKRLASADAAALMRRLDLRWSPERRASAA